MNNKLVKKIQKEREDFWANHIKKWQEDKLPQAEYCRQHKLSKDRFSHWKKIFASADPKEPNQFVELLIQSNLSVPADDCLELTIKEIYKLKISPNFNPELLKKVVWILGG